MRRALRGTSIRGHGQLPQPVFSVEYIPPPIGGWNQRDALPLMDTKDAIVLQNWIPDTNHVRLRSGYVLHSMIHTGFPTPIETLIPYHPPTIGNSKLFAVKEDLSGVRIFDVTAEATASSPQTEVIGLTSARYQYDHLTSTAGTFLTICNGVDAPRQYDGTTWSTPALTGPGSINNLVAVRNHMNRLWFVEENSLIPWYLDVNDITGALTQFEAPFRNGGKLMAVASWTVDGGSGQNDLLVLLSSRGECILYAGYNPNDITTWSLQGRYDIPDVIGRRCVVNSGSDLGILTVQGLVPLSQILGTSVGGASRVAFTDKISGYFRDQWPQSGELFGWQCIEYPRGNLVLINVPLDEGEEQHQAVCNVNVGSWCKFTGINASCWALLNDRLYFGGNNGKVYRYDIVLHTDDEDERGIVGVMQTAYSTFGTPRTKRFMDARPLFLAAPSYDPNVSIQTDYATSNPVVAVAVMPGGGPQWSATGTPDTDPQWAGGEHDPGWQWAGGLVPNAQWDGVAGVGRAVSISFGVSSIEETIYNGADVGFEVGNYY